MAVLMFPKLVSAVLPGCGGFVSFVTAASPREHRWERAHSTSMLKNCTWVYDFGAYLMEPVEMMTQLIRPLTALP